jgi:hypothetical protein
LPGSPPTLTGCHAFEIFVLHVFAEFAAMHAHTGCGTFALWVCIGNTTLACVVVGYVQWSMLRHMHSGVPLTSNVATVRVGMQGDCLSQSVSTHGRTVGIVARRNMIAMHSPTMQVQHACCTWCSNGALVLFGHMHSCGVRKTACIHCPHVAIHASMLQHPAVNWGGYPCT